MIGVNRLGGHQFVINAELIETVEETPDTVITLTTGKRFVVRDSADEVVEKVIAYRRKTYGFPPVPVVKPSGDEGQAEEVEQ